MQFISVIVWHYFNIIQNFKITAKLFLRNTRMKTLHALITAWCFIYEVCLPTVAVRSFLYEFGNKMKRFGKGELAP